MMFKIQKELHIPNFEYFYFLVMIIFCAKMTPETTKMENFGGAIIPFSIPIILTVILISRNKINIGISRLVNLCIVFILWSAISVIRFGSYNFEDFTLYLFLIYSVIIAYCHVGVYGEKMFPLYEDIMVKIALLSIIIWIPFCLLFPGIGEAIFSMFPKSLTGYNVLYLFNWTGLGATGRFRNSGCAWEPGFYALMLAFAIFINLWRNNGLKMKGNKKLWILVIAMLTTTSTTGYVVMLIEFFLFYVKSISFKKVLGAALIFLPIIYYGSQVSFIGEKISISIEDSSDYLGLEGRLTWGEKNSEDKMAIDRIPSAVLQIENFSHDPVIGYGLNDYNSYFFRTNNITNMAYCGGLVQIFSQFGLFIGLFVYYLLYRSSKTINRHANSHNFDFMIVCMLLSISYPIFRCPVFTSFWLFGYFYTIPSIKTRLINEVATL